MKFFYVFLLLGVSGVVRIIVSTSEQGRKIFPVKPPVKKASAAYFRKLDEVIPYESSAKMVFAVKLPVIDVFQAKVTSKETYEAIQSTTRMMKDDFRNYLKGYEGTKKRERRQIVVAASVVAGFLLHSVYSTFTRKLMGTNDEATSYMNELHRSLKSQQRDFLFFHHEVEAFASNYSVFVDKFYKAVSDSEQIDLALLHLNQVQIAIFKVEQGLERCGNHLFPTQIVDIPTLLKQMKNLDRNIENTGYKLAVASHNVAQLLKLKIADCFITHSTVYVLANVPVRKFDWSIEQLVPIPFAFLNQTCSLSSTSPEIIAVRRDQITVIDSYMLEFCDFRNDQLCLIPEYSRPSSQTASCVASLYHGTSLKHISSHCTFQCASTTELSIIQVEKNKVIAVNAESVSVKCPEKHFDYDVEKIGSTAISMKCTCEYKVGDVALDSLGVCIDERFSHEDVIHLVPNFLNISSSTPTGHVYTWPAHVQVLNYTAFDIPTPPSFDVNRITYPDWWMMALSLLILLIFVVLIYAFCYFRNLQ